jgi:hypothetical protein
VAENCTGEWEVPISMTDRAVTNPFDAEHTRPPGPAHSAGRYAGVADILPLTPFQDGLLFHARYDPAAPDVYHVQFCVDLDGDLDAGALHAAADTLVRRHPALRAAFRRRRTGEPGNRSSSSSAGYRPRGPNPIWAGSPPPAHPANWSG